MGLAQSRSTALGRATRSCARLAFRRESVVAAGAAEVSFRPQRRTSERAERQRSNFAEKGPHLHAPRCEDNKMHLRQQQEKPALPCAGCLGEERQQNQGRLLGAVAESSYLRFEIGSKKWRHEGRVGDDRQANNDSFGSKYVH